MPRTPPRSRVNAQYGREAESRLQAVQKLSGWKIDATSQIPWAMADLQGEAMEGRGGVGGMWKGGRKRCKWAK